MDLFRVYSVYKWFPVYVLFIGKMFFTEVNNSLNRGNGNFGMIWTKKRMFYGKCNGTSNWRRMRRCIVKLEGLIREHTRRRRASMVFKCSLLLSVSVYMVFILHFYFVNGICCVRCLHAFIHRCRQFPLSFGRFDGFVCFNQFLCHGQNIWIGSLHCKFSN